MDTPGTPCGPQTSRNSAALVAAPALLGLVAVRIWLQCSVYGRYTATDSGAVTVATNTLRAVLILVMVAVLLRRGFSSRARSVLAAASVATMMAASALFLVATETGVAWLLWVSCALAAFGVVWGGGMWIEAYERLNVRDFVVYAFAALAISCLCGFCLGFLPESFAHLVALFMPAVSYVLYRAAQDQVTVAGLAQIDSDTGRRPFEWRPFVRLVAGVALYDFALGIARGFPYGASIPLDVPFQAFHQLGTAVLCAGVVWFAMRRFRAPRMTVLWGVLLAFVGAGVLLIATVRVPWMGVGASLVSIANTFTLGVLWFTAYETSRRSSVPAWAVLGVLWSAHLLPRELGRAAMMAWGAYNASPLVVAVAMVVPLAASFVLLLKGDEPVTEKPTVVEGPLPLEGGAATDAPTAQDVAVMAVPRLTDDPLERALYVAERRYGLTRREAEVAIPLARGLSKAAIGEKLCLSESTARTHGRNLYAKLGVHSRAQLLALLEQLEGGGASSPGSMRS